MKYRIYYHLSLNNKNESLVPVLEVVDGVDLEITPGVSKKIREKILEGLKKKGWSSHVKLSSVSKINITAMYSRCALCLQTGNMGRFYADLLKLQYLFKKKLVDSAIFIVPTKRMAQIIGGNVANFDRLVDELRLFEDIITIPMVVIGLD